MNFLYHIVNEDVEGGVLYPLNKLRQAHPALYKSHASKYKNRKHVMELYIPQLRCYWGDVIHFSAIHPRIVQKKLYQAGGTKKYPFYYYEVDPGLLDPGKTVVYPNTPRVDPRKTEKGDFINFNPRDLKQWAVFPQETFEYYRSKFAKAESPLLFLFVPHILYKGSIDVSKLRLKHIS